MRLSGDLALNAPFSLTDDTTIHLNGHTITASLSSALFEVSGNSLVFEGNGTIQNQKWIASVNNGGTITINGGTFMSNKEAFTADGTSSTIIFNEGTIHSVETAIVGHRGSIIEMNGGTIETVDNFAIATNGSSGQGGNRITMNGGTILANITSAGYEACGIYVANNDVFTMNDGEILVENGAGLCMRAGNVTIHGGRIAVTGEPGTTGKIGDDGTMMGKSAIIYHESANYPGKAGMSLMIDGGEFVGVDHSLEILSNEATPNVTVTGGSFDPAYPENG